jgi:hypothetical protein
LVLFNNTTHAQHDHIGFEAQRDILTSNSLHSDMTSLVTIHHLQHQAYLRRLREQLFPGGSQTRPSHNNELAKNFPHEIMKFGLGSFVKPVASPFQCNPHNIPLKKLSKNSDSSFIQERDLATFNNCVDILLSTGKVNPLSTHLNMPHRLPLYSRHPNIFSAYNSLNSSWLNILNGIGGVSSTPLIPQLPYGVQNATVPASIDIQVLQGHEAKRQKIVNISPESSCNERRAPEGIVMSSELPTNSLHASLLPIEEKSRHFTFPQILYTKKHDEENLSDFQCCIRKYIEIFEADEEDVNSSAQGRHKVILRGQVGIRCCHCANLPPRCRMRGSTYYPSTLHGLYQAAQNMAGIHFNSFCHLLPEAVRTELKKTQGVSKSNARGGKEYWAQCLKVRGLIELNGRIYIHR